MKKTRWGLLGAGILLERWMKGFRQIEDAVKEYIPGCQGIKIADFPDQPDIDHQSIPEYDIEIVNIYDEEELINFIFNENVYLKTTCD